MNSLVLVSYGGGHVAMLAPIAEALSRESIPFTFIALTTARSYLNRLNIPAIGFCDLPEATDEESLYWSVELVKDGLSLQGPVKSEETLAYHGASFRDLVLDVGEDSARRMFRSKGRQAFLPVSTIKRVLERIKPRLVVTTSAPRAERATIIAASQLQIPTVCLVDLFAVHEVEWLKKPEYATKICVLNNDVRKFLLLHGRRSDEVVVTGNPAFDAMTKLDSVLERRRIRAKRGWSEKQQVILWASQVEPRIHPFSGKFGDPSLPRQVEKCLRDIIAIKKNWTLVVRHHPSEQVNPMVSDRVEYSHASESIASLIHAVDVVVVMTSTVGLEANLAGKPVVSVDKSVFTADTPYAAMGISKGITDLDDMEVALDDALRFAGPKLSAVSPSTSSTDAVMAVIFKLLK